MSNKYWSIYRVDPASNGKGYRIYFVWKAQEFLGEQFPQVNASEVASSQQETEILIKLLPRFRLEQDSISNISRALAGLCLRCYISQSILIACKKLASRFDNQCLTYHELLPFVLDDDGQTLILLDSDGKNQLILNGTGEPRPASYHFFSVEVLGTYRLNSEPKLNLNNWVHRKVRQSQDIREFLSQRGFNRSTSWALLNRVRPKQLERLSQDDRALVETFHAVYRRDRTQQRQRGEKCPDPTNEQLREMLTLLRERAIAILSPEELKQELKTVAKGLRQYDIWTHGGAPPPSLLESLEVIDVETWTYVDREIPDLRSHDLEQLEKKPILSLLEWERQIEVLDQAIEQALHEKVTSMQQRPRYAPLAANIIPGLQLFYSQDKSLREIAALLGMNNHTQASRVLDPTNLFYKVRCLTREKLLHLILEKVEILCLEVAKKPDYLESLGQFIDSFLDSELFQDALAEISTRTAYSKQSVYAQRIRRFLETNSN